jgi:hypothetical protein
MEPFRKQIAQRMADLLDNPKLRKRFGSDEKKYKEVIETLGGKSKKQRQKIMDELLEFEELDKFVSP